MRSLLTFMLGVTLTLTFSDISLGRSFPKCVPPGFSIIVESLQEAPPLDHYLPLGDGRWLKFTEILRELLHIPSIDILIQDTNELRFLPYVLPHSHILLATKDEGVIDEVRQSKLAEAAQLLNVKISILWLGKKQNQNLERLARRLYGYYISRQDILRLPEC